MMPTGESAKAKEKVIARAHARARLPLGPVIRHPEDLPRAKQDAHERHAEAATTALDSLQITVTNSVKLRQVRMFGERGNEPRIVEMRRRPGGAWRRR